MSDPSSKRRTIVSVYPAYQQYVHDSLSRALGHVPDLFALETSHVAANTARATADVQWSDYDEIDWDALTGDKLVNSYVIRKGLIRKNHLAHTIALYLSKNPDSLLKRAVPQTFFFNLTFPDELDELLMDDLYEVAQSLHSNDAIDAANEKEWWILKAALADKGNGIRLFSSTEALEAIFEEFEPQTSDEEDEEEEGEATQTAFGSGTRVDSSQLREWVVQRYISSPLLMDPSPADEIARKFHLRVYIVAAGSLRVYVHRPFLALFAPIEYEPPRETDDGRVNLASHLTNTCLQTSSEEYSRADLAVSTLSALVGKTILSGSRRGQKLEQADVQRIEDQVSDIVAEVFKAAVGAATSFQTLPNAFEIFGCDFLVDSEMAVSLLEVNACPDFGQTGSELQAVIDELFKETVDKVIVPFFEKDKVDSVTQKTTDMSISPGTGLKQVLDMQVRKAW
ncbi:putative tubulin--tyrosine ligase pby1 [Microbotryomycetes sp. JL201]|nr:putative tubulin--tyrosine ligase pby1 [Microbotryomycetes sp. JL201]